MGRRTLGCLFAVLLGATACTTGAADRAGGKAEVTARVIKVVQSSGTRPAQLNAWAHEVAQLSGGHLTIEFVDGWHWGDVDFERHTVRDVQQGVVDLASVGARVLDRVGVTDFEPLLAPLLVDSYDLEGRVFDAGIPDEMLTAVQKLGVVGIGVLPGPMRKMLGTDAPFTGPESFKGKRIGFPDSAVAARTFTALGATGQAIGGTGLDGFDGLEQQLGPIYHSHYGTSARFVTGNLDLWPRPSVILMNRDAYRRLGQGDQQILREAAQRAEGASLDASRAEDREALDQLCRFGMSMPAASEDDLARLRAAVQPVFVTIRADPRTATWLARIEALKAELGAPPQSAACPATTAPTSPLDGTWETTLTTDDWSRWPKSESKPGRWRLSFDRGTMSIIEPSGDVGYKASFEAFKGRLETHGEADVLSIAYRLSGNTVTFSDVRIVGDSCTDCSPYATGLGSHPWRRVQAG